jgi:hypothetical protein
VAELLDASSRFKSALVERRLDRLGPRWSMEAVACTARFVIGGQWFRYSIDVRPGGGIGD